MDQSILIVDDDDARRRALGAAAADLAVRYLDVGDAFAAMAAIGRADFGVIIAAEGRRTLSLRGLCQLARKRHPGIHILILRRATSSDDQILQVLGEGVHVVDPAEPVLDIARRARDLLATVPAAMPLPPLTGQVGVFDVDLEPTQKTTRAALPSDSGPQAPSPVDVLLPPVTTSPSWELTEPMPRAHTPPAVAAVADPNAPALVMEGTFDGGAGPGLLVGLFTQELTGRLDVFAGNAAGALYFYRGEPVWADDPQGDAGLYRRLVQTAVLAPTTPVEAVPEGQLLGSLAQKGTLSGQAIHEFMRELVRDRVLALAVQQGGAYRFTEDRAFLDVAPLLKVNPFGLVIESRRRSLSPQEILSLGVELEHKYLAPAPALSPAADKLAPFVRGQNLATIIDGSLNVHDVLQRVGLDIFMGTLVLVTLRDARLVTVEDQPKKSRGGVTLRNVSSIPHESDITAVDVEVPAPMSTDEATAREAIFTLYMQLKPLTAPRQILGVGFDADDAALDAAYQRRMTDLDPRRVPESSAQQLLTQRVEELRRKVTAAYQMLKLESQAVPAPLALPSDTPPFE